MSQQHEILFYFKQSFPVVLRTPHSPGSSANSLTSQKSSYLQLTYLLSNFEMMDLFKLGSKPLLCYTYPPFLQNLINSKYFKWQLLMWPSISVPQLQTHNQLSTSLSCLYTQHIHDFIHDLLLKNPHPGHPTPCPSPYPPSFLYVLIWVSASFSLCLGHHVLLDMPPE